MGNQYQSFSFLEQQQQKPVCLTILVPPVLFKTGSSSAFSKPCLLHHQILQAHTRKVHTRFLCVITFAVMGWEK